MCIVHEFVANCKIIIIILLFYNQYLAYYKIQVLYSEFCLQGPISVKHQLVYPVVLSVIIISVKLANHDLVKSSHAVACEVESEVESLLL